MGKTEELRTFLIHQYILVISLGGLVW